MSSINRHRRTIVRSHRPVRKLTGTIRRSIVTGCTCDQCPGTSATRISCGADIRLVDVMDCIVRPTGSLDSGPITGVGTRNPVLRNSIASRGSACTTSFCYSRYLSRKKRIPTGRLTTGHELVIRSCVIDRTLLGPHGHNTCSRGRDVTSTLHRTTGSGAIYYAHTLSRGLNISCVSSKG
jgi:hypothetical protein